MSKLQRFIDFALRLLQLDEVSQVQQDRRPEQSESLDETSGSAISNPRLEIEMITAEGTREALHVALQEHLVALGSVGVLCDWVVTAEVAEADGTRSLSFAFSEDLTAWKLRGLSYYSGELLDRYTS